MGAISFTIDAQLVRELSRLLPFTRFVETGTFRGESLDLVQASFAQCLSIELSPEYYAAARQRFAGNPAVKLLQGDSAAVLREQREVFAGQPTLFWLDAHWCAAENTAGEISQCPLLAELTAIGPLHPRSTILIDDARLFLCPPPKPHEISAWPDLGAIIAHLHRLSDQHALACFNDVLVFAPREVLAKLRPFLSEHTVNLLTLADKARDYDSILTQAKVKDQENASILEQAKAKDRENALLLEQTRAKDCENALLLEQAKAREQEIQLLHATARERLAVIQKLDVALSQSRRTLVELGHNPNKANSDLTALTDEIASLRVQLDEARRQLQLKHIQLRKLEHGEIRAKRATTSFPHRLLARWQTRLAKTTLSRLAKLQQYPPRPVLPEKFPRPVCRSPWPRICIATPSYQQAQFLERTMRSVLDQNYPNLAYGVQDGGSTDGSAEIITRYLSRLAHAESTPDNGQSDAIRRGFAKLYLEENDLMGWLNSDDTLMPGALHYVGAYFARHPEVDVIYGHRVVIDEQDREIGRWFLPRYHADTLKWFDLVPQETLFWRARCYRDVGGLDASFQFAMDWDLLLRFEQAGFNIHRVPYFLGCFRVHTAQKTSTRIQTIGEEEMQRLRLRTHQRTTTHSEIHQQLNGEINRSAMIAWLHRWGIRS